jgi:hypothetical protein
MKTLKLVCTVLAGTLMSSCSFFDDKGISSYLSDMETQYAWTDTPSPNLVLNDMAYSGTMVCRIDAANAYSPTFNLKVKECANGVIPTVVKVGAWLKCTSNEAKPTLVVEVRDENKNPITWMGESFTGPKLILNEWSYYEHEFKLSSDFMKENNYLRIYCTNDKTQAVLCDDLSVIFY